MQKTRVRRKREQAKQQIQHSSKKQSSQQSGTNHKTLSSNHILQLQQTMGNQYVQRLLSTSAPQIQRVAVANVLLNDQQAKSAVNYNRKKGMSVDQIKQIQQLVGVNDDGVIGKQTVQAIASWQSANGLEVDGKIGSKTADKMAQAVNQQMTNNEPATNDEFKCRPIEQ